MKTLKNYFFYEKKREKIYNILILSKNDTPKIENSKQICKATGNVIKIHILKNLDNFHFGSLKIEQVDHFTILFTSKIKVFVFYSNVTKEDTYIYPQLIKYIFNFFVQSLDNKHYYHHSLVTGQNSHSLI